ncbi:MAG TPA: S8 family serine peptidase [Planctomycetota bacterium]|nr:S8 family serine peptidase [Planctomycetota bacterium]HRU52128.1 S8 family serine peptidase [Planctomycetota bacterium]
MNKLICFFLLFCVCSVFGQHRADMHNIQAMLAEEHSKNTIMVRFIDTALEEEQSAILSKLSIQKQIKINLVKNLYVLKLQDNSSLEEALQILLLEEKVQYAVPSYKRKLLGTYPNDPDLGQQWHLDKIQAPQVWDTHTDASDIIVAVIDSGVDYTHPDLQDNMWDDGHGNCGYDFCNNDNDPMDDNGHGTHVAGIIGAVANNGIGISGICWRVKIMALKFLDDFGSGEDAHAIQCMDYAIQHGAKILNNSWGGEGEYDPLLDAIWGTHDAGCLFIAAAGNENKNNDEVPSYPANYKVPNIISVGATDKNDNRAYFSNYGVQTVHLAAPGVDIYSTLPDDNYDFDSGTSMACPVVSGAAALCWTKFPILRNIQIKQKILYSVDTLPIKWNMTQGRLNVKKLLEEPEFIKVKGGGGGCNRGTHENNSIFISCFILIFLYYLQRRFKHTIEH